MPISPVKLDATAVDVTVTDDRIVVVLADGRELAAPLAWFPRLLEATPEQRRNGDSSGVDTASTGPTSTRTSPSRVCCARRESCVPREHYAAIKA